MSRAKTRDIDVAKFRRLIESWGGASLVARKIHRSPSSIGNVLSRGYISIVFSDAIKDVFGVPYEDYMKKEDDEDVKVVADLPEIDNENLKDIAALLRQICNNQTAIYKRLNHITGEVVRINEKMEG